MNTVDLTCYLVVAAVVTKQYDPGGSVRGKPSVRVSKGKPSTSANEVAIKLDVKLPVALFLRPDLEAKLTVPAEKVPFTISPEMTTNIAEAIRQSTGLAVVLSVQPPTE